MALRGLFLLLPPMQLPPMQARSLRSRATPKMHHCCLALPGRMTEYRRGKPEDIHRDFAQVKGDLHVRLAIRSTGDFLTWVKEYGANRQLIRIFLLNWTP
jgi:hypothetical protein